MTDTMISDMLLDDVIRSGREVRHLHPDDPIGPQTEEEE